MLVTTVKPLAMSSLAIPTPISPIERMPMADGGPDSACAEAMVSLGSRLVMITD